MTRVGGTPVGRAMEMDGDLESWSPCIKYHMSLLSYLSWALDFSICYQSRPEGICEGCQPVLDALK